jgi:hypothetical protein
MAGHGPRYQALVAAIRGQKVEPAGSGDSGSLNYKFMDAFTAYIVRGGAAKERCLELLQQSKLYGHCTLKGPAGYACEQGAPGAHRYFTMAAVRGGLKYALSRGDVDLVHACREFELDEAALCLRFRWGKKTVLPSPRVKDEKQMRPFDGYRDLDTAMLLGENPKRKDSFWKEDQSVASLLLCELVARAVFTPEEVRRRKLPKLLLPIERRDVEGGFLAWVDRTPTSEKAMGRDGCNWVLCSTSGISAGFDWSPLPEVA